MKDPCTEQEMCFKRGLHNLGNVMSGEMDAGDFEWPEPKSSSNEGSCFFDNGDEGSDVDDDESITSGPWDTYSEVVSEANIRQQRKKCQDELT